MRIPATMSDPARYFVLGHLGSFDGKKTYSVLSLETMDCYEAFVDLGIGSVALLRQIGREELRGAR